MQIPSRRRAVAAAVAAALCAIAEDLGAQQPAGKAPARRPVFGRVEGASGPIDGALVCLFGCHTGALSDAETDVVRVSTQDGGRYRADLIVGMPYFGFATSAWNDGEREASEVRGWFGAGASVDFVCRERVAARTVDVRGLDAWQQGDALRILARPLCAERGPEIGMPIAVEMTKGADGLFAWPDVPFGRVEAVGQDGFAVWSGAQSVRNMADFAVPPPSDFACRVVDEAGKPVAGAVVSLRVEGRYDSGIDGIETTRSVPTRRVANVDESGRATMRLPFSGNLFAAGSSPARMFVATASGYEDQVSGVRGNDVYRNGEKGDAPADGVLQFTMRKADPIRGVVAKGLGLGRDGARVQLRHVGLLRVGEGAFLHDPRLAIAQIRDDGCFEFEGVSPQIHEHQWVVQLSRYEPPIVLRRREGAANPEGLTWGLGSLAEASLSVVDPDAGPAAGQCVYAVRTHLQHDPSSRGPWDAIRLVTDGGGRLRAKFAADAWGFVTVSERGYGRVAFELDPGTKVQHELRMKPFPTMRLLVQDSSGAPIAGATASLRQNISKGWQSESDVELLARWTTRVVLPTGAQRKSAADGSLEVALPVFLEAIEALEGDEEARESRSGLKFSLAVHATGKRTEIVEATYEGEPVKVVLR